MRSGVSKFNFERRPTGGLVCWSRWADQSSCGNLKNGQSNPLEEAVSNTLHP